MGTLYLQCLLVHSGSLVLPGDRPSAQFLATFCFPGLGRTSYSFPRNVRIGGSDVRQLQLGFLLPMMVRVTGLVCQSLRCTTVHQSLSIFFFTVASSFQTVCFFPDSPRTAICAAIRDSLHLESNCKPDGLVAAPGQRQGHRLAQR